VDAKLSCQVLYDPGRHVRRVAQEGSQKPHGTELQGEAQAVVIAAPDGNQST
jgi:hypothetical protein